MWIYMFSKLNYVSWNKLLWLQTDESQCTRRLGPHLSQSVLRSNSFTSATMFKCSLEALIPFLYLHTSVSCSCIFILDFTSFLCSLYLTSKAFTLHYFHTKKIMYLRLPYERREMSRTPLPQLQFSKVQKHVQISLTCCNEEMLLSRWSH